MKNRLLAVWIAVALVVFAPLCSLAEARYPALRGAVTDDANVLSKETVDDIVSFQTMAKARADVTVYVVMVHFLDGVDAQTYANTLFTRWGLGENDFLLLGAAGEDSFASATGKSLKEKFSDANAQSLLFTSGFGAAFKEQRYDEAFEQYFIAFTDMLNKKYDVDVQLDKLFSNISGVVEKAKPSKPSRSNMWGIVSEKIDDSARSYEEKRQRWQEHDGWSAGEWIILVVLILLIFGRKSPVRKAYRKRTPIGCGCSPVGWIFGIFGLGMLFGKKR